MTGLCDSQAKGGVSFESVLWRKYHDVKSSPFIAGYGNSVSGAIIVHPSHISVLSQKFTTLLSGALDC